MNTPDALKLEKPPLDYREELKLLTSNKNQRDDSEAMEKTNKILAGLARQLAAIATTAWKMQRRVMDPETQDVRASLSSEDAKKLARNVESLMDIFTDMGITIRDRTGQAFDYGMPEKVIDARTQPGITKERVLETLRPTVMWTTEFWNDTMIQKGEVIIQTP